MVRLTKKVCAIAIFAALATVCISTNTFAAEVEVSDFTEFQTALANGDDIKIGADFALSGVVTFDKPATLDLNGHKLDASSALIDIESTVIFDDKSENKEGEINSVIATVVSWTTENGNLTINAGLIENDYSTVQFVKKGSITMNGGTISNYDCKNGSAVFVNGGSTFTMNGGSIISACTINDHSKATVTVTEDGSEFIMNGGEIISDAMGVAVFANCKFIMNGGKISASDQGVTTNGTEDPTSVNYGANAEITINDGTITSSTTAAIYAPSVDGKTQINGGTITGKTGIEIRAGELEIKGGKITATADNYTSVNNGNGTTTDGAAIAIAQHNTKKTTKITICSGTMTGYVALGEANPQGNDNSDISKITLVIGEACGDEPEFISTNTADNADVIKIENFDIINKFVKGGRFSHRVPADFIADGYVEPNEKDNGMYYVTRPHDVTVDATTNGTASASKATAMKGDEVEITTTPADGYELDVVTVKDADGNAITVSNGKFAMPAKDVTVTVTFKEVPAEPTEPEEKPENPATYDDIAIYFVIMGASLGGLAAAAITKKFF